MQDRGRPRPGWSTLGAMGARAACVCFLGSMLLAGCAAPGSALGRIGISGTIVSGQPLESMQVTLPKSYGLGGLDLLMNKPEDFGNTDRQVVVHVADGQFSYEFQPIVYHITFWLLPPLGPFPRHPPEPFFTVAFSSTPDELYLMGFEKGVFRYEVYRRSSHAHLAHDHASWIIETAGYVKEHVADHDRWVLRIRVHGV